MATKARNRSRSHVLGSIVRRTSLVGMKAAPKREALVDQKNLQRLRKIYDDATRSPEAKKQALDCDRKPKVSDDACLRHRQALNDFHRIRRKSFSDEAKRLRVGKPPILATPDKEKSEYDTVCNMMRKLSVTPPSAPPVPEGVKDIDGDGKDLFNCPDLASDIIEYLKEAEKKFKLSETCYDKKGQAVNADMRSILLDWLTQVQCHLKLEQTTLHLAAIIVDLVVSRKNVPLGKLQLLGITALFIACKFEERFAPEVERLIHLTNYTYTEKEVLKMELRVLRFLDFRVNIPGPIIFIERFLKVVDNNQKLNFICRYIIDLSLTDVYMINYLPSMKAAAALCLALKISLRDDRASESTIRNSWTRDLRHYTGYTERQLLPCVRRYSRLLMKAEKSKSQGAREKYASRKCGSISLWYAMTSSVTQQYASEFGSPKAPSRIRGKE